MERSLTPFCQEMVDLIVGDVTAYVGGEEASDDITIVASDVRSELENLKSKMKNHRWTLIY